MCLRVSLQRGVLMDDAMVQGLQNRQSGVGTIEVVVALSLFGLALVSLFALHMVALSGSTTAETSSIATNLARARMETVSTLPPAEILAQNGREATQQVPSGSGRVYRVQTMVTSSDPDRLDIQVTVTWQVATGSGCAAGPSAGCTGSTATYTRTLQTRVTRFQL